MFSRAVITGLPMKEQKVALGSPLKIMKKNVSRNQKKTVSAWAANTNRNPALNQKRILTEPSTSYITPKKPS